MTARTAALIAVALVVSLVSPVRADVFVPPPVERTPMGPTLRGQPYVASMSTVADHVLFTARNPTAVAVTLTLATLTQAGGAAVPLTRIEANGRAVSGAAITIPPGGTVHLVIYVPQPTNGARRTFVLHATLAGRSTTATATVSQQMPPRPHPPYPAASS